jgi:hypothetical protein
VSGNCQVITVLVHTVLVHASHLNSTCQNPLKII